MRASPTLAFGVKPSPVVSSEIQSSLWADAFEIVGGQFTAHLRTCEVASSRESEPVRERHFLRFPSAFPSSHPFPRHETPRHCGRRGTAWTPTVIRSPPPQAAGARTALLNPCVRLRGPAALAPLSSTESLFTFERPAKTTSKTLGQSATRHNDSRLSKTFSTFCCVRY